MSFQHDAFQHDAFQVEIEGGAAADAPFTPVEFPRPKPPARPQPFWYNLTYDVIAAVAPFVAVDFRRPALARRQYGYGDVVVNLLLTTLAATAVAPVVNIHEPPARVAKAVRSEAAPNLTAFLQNAQGIPFATPEWKKPVVPPLARTEPPPNLLTGALAPTSADAPFINYEWAKPREPQRSQAFWYNLTYDPAVSYDPFIPVEWKQPARAKSVLSDAVPNLLTATLASAPQQSPFVNIDERTLRQVKRTADEVPQNLLTGALAPAVATDPLLVFEWVPPRPIKRAEAWFYNLTYDPTAAYTTPAVAYDWPKPKEIRLKPPGAEQNLLTGTLTPAAAATAPFVNISESQRRAVKRSLTDAADNLLTGTLASSDVLPRAVLVTRKPANIRVKPEGAAPNLLVGTLAPAQASPDPFFSYFWPVPKRQPQQVQEPLVNLLTGTLFVAPPSPDPFTQLEWKRPITVRLRGEDAQDNLLTGTLTPPTPVPGPTVDYQGDGKKRKHRNKTKELFDDIERTLNGFFKPVSVSIKTENAAVENDVEIQKAYDKLAKIARGDKEMVDRLRVIEKDLADYKERKIQEDDDDWMMM